MSKLAYNCVRWTGLPAFLTSCTPVLLHSDRAERTGGYVLASNHLSPYDVPLLIAYVTRPLDFMSIIEFKRNPWVKLLFDGMNTFYLDRSRTDSGTVRTAVQRLKSGRVVAMFPEGGFRSSADSLLAGGTFKPGIARLAELSGAPVLPCVVLGSAQYRKFKAWLPTRQTRIGINFGEPLYFQANAGPDPREAFLARLRHAYHELHRELAGELKWPASCVNGPDPG